MTEAEKHNWSTIKERKGAVIGLRILLRLYRLLGHRFFRVVLYPVIFFYWLTGRKGRLASKQFFDQIRQYAIDEKIELPVRLNSFHHYVCFTEAILDKFLSWTGGIKYHDLIIPYLQDELENPSKNKQGRIILGSHLGNLEVCRALGQINTDQVIHAIVFTAHASGFNRVLTELNPSARFNLIEIPEMTPETIIFLQERLQQGDWIAIMGDRVPAGEYYRNSNIPISWQTFLGRKAAFPKGPFIIAWLLKYPIYFMIAIKEGNPAYTLYFEELSLGLTHQRSSRTKEIEALIDYYCQRLEYYTLKSPLEWFNFYEFWNEPNRPDHPNLTDRSRKELS